MRKNVDIVDIVNSHSQPKFSYRTDSTLIILGSRGTASRDENNATNATAFRRYQVGLCTIPEGY